MRPTPAHHAVVCSACGLRFPVPLGDDRYGTCPACEAPTHVVDEYPDAVRPTGDLASVGRVVAVLDNVRSAMNVGTILRTADGARLNHVHLCGITPAGDHPKVVKTALDAEQHVPWSHHVDAVACCASLVEQGYAIWAIEAAVGSETVTDLEVPAQVALVVGNERAGIDPGILRLAHRVLHLPMAGAKTSLNVAVAFGVVAYRVRS